MYIRIMIEGRPDMVIWFHDADEACDWLLVFAQHCLFDFSTKREFPNG